MGKNASKRQKSNRHIKGGGKLTVINPNAAGIDVGSEENWVAVPDNREGQIVRKFGFCTSDIQLLADWLDECGIETVAMESTGVYWIPIFDILESRGFEVILVNAREAKNVPGRKTDEKDCQWLQKLHMYGLLHASFRPSEQICELRTLIRQRDILIKSGSQHIQRMQKALTQMNVQLHKVISDIVGETGRAIIEAIISGERDSKKLAQLKNWRIKKSTAEIAKALEGNWRKELVFCLKQEYDFYNFTQDQVRSCDQQIKECLEKFDSKLEISQSNTEKKNDRKNGRALYHSIYRVNWFA